MSFTHKVFDAENNKNQTIIEINPNSDSFLMKKDYTYIPGVVKRGLI